ncbi:MAG: fumarate reductase/succinate dehydrogenase flavoprotein subunit [Bacteroidia bacterium]|nr:fumarate reductase/succinate dehydrogenase flavoprotein subunit [Bacteroidia bacterium]MCX7652625.1 fumarate reductase/succinate dehydrogenase flavoprotein subunit [Bacteroidia bacterium]MDW8417022.1 fumarate reductase/succinate dehydrogenase flavoprotein subunit [Bacteroidia bacterium]
MSEILTIPIPTKTEPSISWTEGSPILENRCPSGDLEKRWTRHKDSLRLVAPHNKRKLEVIVVGAGLAGASAAASLGELGYQVKVFVYHNSPRRAHSIAAQGGINAAKNYRNDGDSIWRLFYDTIKGGDFRARESNVYRLAEVSVKIIDHCVAQGIPFAREYGGYLDTRSFGGAQLMRTFYARGQTGQQLLLGAYAALQRQVELGNVKVFYNHELLDVVVDEGRARGVIVRNLITGEIHRVAGHAVVLATGGYGNAYYLSTNAKLSNATAIWRAHRRGAFFANPSFVQIHPTCIPQSGEYQSKLTLMSESLRNDGRVWVPRTPGDKRAPQSIPENERWYYLEEWYPSFGNLVPRDIASRAAKRVCDMGYGVGPTGRAVYLDFSDAIKRFGREVIYQRYGNLFEMYEEITGESPWETPMRIYPAVHYTMGGLWVDYNLMTNIPGLYAIGEANFSDHGANRLGASALMQGLADGYFILPYTIGDYLATQLFVKNSTDTAAFADAEKETRERIEKVLSTKGTRTVDEFHRELGKILWDSCGLARSASGLSEAFSKVRELRERFWQEVRVPGTGHEFNQNLEKALRVSDFFELGELMIVDAYHREESCGCHLREEYQTEEGEALRNDNEYAYVAAWEWAGEGKPPILHKEPLKFEFVKPTVRSYK